MIVFLLIFALIIGCGSAPSTTGAGGFGGTASSSVSSVGVGNTTCFPGNKACGSVCVPLGMTENGCSEPGCKPCSYSHGTAACVDGLCALASCAAGWADCNGNVADGCEQTTVKDSSNCGGCGVVCTLPNTVHLCTAGKCSTELCVPGFGDCDGDPSNGCETHTDSDPAACGSCGVACPGDEWCDTGACRSCSVTYDGPSSVQEYPSTFGDSFTWPWVPDHDVLVTDISIVHHDDTGTSWILLVYADNAGAPKSPPSQLFVAPANGQGAPRHFIGGTRYWMALAESGPPGYAVFVYAYAGAQVPTYYLISSPGPQKWSAPTMADPPIMIITGTCE